MKTTDWSPQEDALLVEGHRLHGNKWSMLAGIIGGRWEICCDALHHHGPHWSWEQGEAQAGGPADVGQEVSAWHCRAHRNRFIMLPAWARCLSGIE